MLNEYLTPGSTAVVNGSTPQDAFSVEYDPFAIKASSLIPVVASGIANNVGVVDAVGGSSSQSVIGPVAPDGTVSSGQQGYDVGTGWWLGTVGGVPKFSLGNSSGNKVTWDGTTLTIVGLQQVIQFFTTAEAVTTGQAVFVADGTETRNIIPANNTTGQSVFQMGSAGGNTLYGAQTFVTPAAVTTINQVSLNMNKVGSPTGNVVVSLYATSSGLPTGSALANSSTTLTAASVTNSNYNFAFNYSASGSTTYAIVISGITGSGPSNCIQVQGPVGGGSGGVSSSSDGTNWTGSSSQIANTVRYLFASSGQVALTSTDSTNSPGQYASFIGFVYTTTAKGGSVPIILSGSAIGLSALTIKGQYYLQDTAGAIGTSAGSNTRKCGIAVSSSQLVITNIW